MALVRIEGFNAVETADIALVGTITTGTPTIDNVNQRNGDGCLSLNGYNEAFAIACTFTDEKFVVGFAINFVNLPTLSFTSFLQFRSGFDELTIGVTSTGQIQVKRATSVLGTSDPVIVADDTWYYFEMKGEISDSTTIETVCIVDGGVVLTLPTTTDTSNGTPGTIDIELIHGAIAAQVVLIDDLYICDHEGSECNDLLGDCVVETIYPDGNGYNSDFVGSDVDSTDNYLHVDESDTPDGDTSYIESSTPTDIDAFTYAAMAGSDIGTIHAVQANTIAKKDDANPRTIKQLARLSSTNYEGSEEALSTAYARYGEIWELNPDDSAAWEEADVNAAEFGIKVEA